MKFLRTIRAMLAIGGLALGQASPAQEGSAAQASQALTPLSTVAPTVYRVGGDVKPPQPIYMPDPEFSRDARKKKMSGSVLVRLIVDANGHPQQVHVIRSLAEKAGKKEQKAALSLDTKALEAVQQYRFKPATRDGLAVPVEMNVEVNFVIF